MLRLPLRIFGPLIALCSCQHVPLNYGPEDMAPPWGRQGFIQGYVGVAELANLDSELGAGDFIEDDDDATLPTLGGAMGEYYTNPANPMRLGVEGGFNVMWDQNRRVLLGGSSLPTSERRVDLTFVDTFVGLSVDLALSQRFRLYGGAGPVLQYGEMRIESETDDDNTYDNGFGVGLYARAGFEFALYPGGWAGFGVRWLETAIDLGAGSDLELEAFQMLFTATGTW